MVKTDICTLPIPYEDDEIDIIENLEDDSDSDDFTPKKLLKLQSVQKIIRNSVYSRVSSSRDVYICLIMFI